MSGFRTRTALGFAVLMIVTALTGFTGTTQPAGAAPAAAGGDLVIATRGSAEPASLDGQIDPYANTWLMNSWVADRLLMLTPEGEYKPMLAERWTLSPNGKVLTIFLRSGLKFQDGTDIDAEAVKFNIERVINPETRSALMAGQMGQRNYQRVEVLDKKTLKVYYSGPVPTIFWGMSIMPIWSPTAVRRHGVNFHQNLVGRGPYRMTQWTKGSHIRFERDPSYTGITPWQEGKGVGRLNSVTFRFVGEDAVLGEVLRSGEVNMVMELPAQVVNTYRNNPNFQVVPGYQSGSGMQFVINTSRPGLDDVRVRRAMRHAYDQDRMNQALFDGLYVANKGPLTKYTRCFWAGANDAYRLDLDRARALLEEAGWRPGLGGVRQKDGQRLSFMASTLHHREILEYLQAQFRPIGIDLRVEVIPGPVQLQRAISGDFDIIYQRLRSFEPDDLYQLWHSSNLRAGGWSWSRYQDAKLDQALAMSQNTSDPRERCRLFTEAQQIVTQAAAALPTLDNPIYYGMHRRVKGFKLGATGGWFFVNDMVVER